MTNCLKLLLSLFATLQTTFLLNAFVYFLFFLKQVDNRITKVQVTVPRIPTTVRKAAVVDHLLSVREVNFHTAKPVGRPSNTPVPMRSNRKDLPPVTVDTTIRAATVYVVIEVHLPAMD